MFLILTVGLPQWINVLEMGYTTSGVQQDMLELEIH